jgi:hypothetical protein
MLDEYYFVPDANPLTREKGFTPWGPRRSHHGTDHIRRRYIA